MNPRPEQALLVLNALTSGGLVAGPPGPQIILATAVKEYVNGEDIVNHTTKAFARETGNGRVADNGTHFRLENTAFAAGTRTEIPSKNAISGDFSGSTALSIKARVVTASSVFSRLRFAAGLAAEPRNSNGTEDVLMNIFTNGAADPIIEIFYRNLSGVLTLLASTSSYPIAETATMKIERTGGSFVYTASTPTLGTVCVSILQTLVLNGSSNLFANITRVPELNQTEEFEVNEIGGYPIP